MDSSATTEHFRRNRTYYMMILVGIICLICAKVNATYDASMLWRIGFLTVGGSGVMFGFMALCMNELHWNRNRDSD